MKAKKMTPEKLKRLRNWYYEKMRLGTNKTIAVELGVSEGYIERLLLPIREDWLIDPQLQLPLS